MIRARATLGLLLALALQRPSSGQQPPIFRSETRLVVLYATVTNGRGEVVTGLDENAFTVFENGKRQPIALFRRDDIPVSVGLLIDNSGSMRRLRAKVEAAALAFARASNPEDEMFVLNFADKARIDVPLTSDLHRLEAGIARVDSIGGTAMYDAIEMAEAYLAEHATRDRKVLLVITDGNDNASLTPLARIEQQAEGSGVVIDAIGLFADNDPGHASKGRHELDRLVARTGGLASYPTSVDQIEMVALDLAQRIRNQYMIAYAPLNQSLDGSYRTIRLTATGPPTFTVHTRAGYRATAP